MPIPGGYSMVELKGLDLDKPTGTITPQAFKKLHDAKDPVIVYGMNFNGKEIPPSYMTIETREDGEILGVFGRYLLFINNTDVVVEKIANGVSDSIYVPIKFTPLFSQDVGMQVTEDYRILNVGTFDDLYVNRFNYKGKKLIFSTPLWFRYDALSGTASIDQYIETAVVVGNGMLKFTDSILPNLGGVITQQNKITGINLETLFKESEALFYGL